MTVYKNCRAIVVNIGVIDTLVETSFDTNGDVSRIGESLSYHVRFNNEADIIQFKKHMQDLGIQVDNKIFNYDNSADVPDSIVKELLVGPLEIKRIWKAFVHDDDQIILVDD